MSSDDPERDRRALELRMAGLSVDRIADALSFEDADAVRTSVQRTLHAAPALDEAHRLELSRLDAMQRALWSDAIKGKRPAILTCLAIMERRARLLGLDGKREEQEDDRIDQLAERRSQRRAGIAKTAGLPRS